jgi:hypothetical protein
MARARLLTAALLICTTTAAVIETIDVANRFVVLPHVLAGITPAK